MFAKNSRLPFAIQLFHKFRRRFALMMAVLLSWMAVSVAHGAVVLTNLVLFNGTNGANPEATLIQGTDGKLYGTTYNGGTNGGYGTVFQMTTNGALTTLVSFNNTNGANPSGALVQGVNGILYGTTYAGGTYAVGTNAGYGTVFQITTNGVLTSMVSFNNTNGANPFGALARGANGNLYGTTYGGGTNGGFGTVFQVTTNRVLTSLFSFNFTNGANPQSALVLAGDGNFYGTTSAGGTNGGDGTLFKITGAGMLTSLFSFNDADGSFPYAGLTLGSHGMLYGATAGGGANGNINGTLFQITTSGLFSSLISFDNTNGATPYAAPIQGADGNFYGTTSAGGVSNNNFGTIFEMTANGSLATLYSFSGAFPFAGLVQGADGNFYGTTYGGLSFPSGTIFRITIPPLPVVQSVTSTGSTLTITWSAVIGQKYQLQYTTSLSPTAWNNLGPSVAASTVTVSASDVVGPDPQRFYRVALLP